MMEELSKCTCGATPKIDWSAAIEISGTAWQSVGVDCPDCNRWVAMRYDGDREGPRATSIATTAWNSLVRRKSDSA